MLATPCGVTSPVRTEIAERLLLTLELALLAMRLSLVVAFITGILSAVQRHVGRLPLSGCEHCQALYSNFWLGTRVFWCFPWCSSGRRRWATSIFRGSLD